MLNRILLTLILVISFIVTGSAAFVAPAVATETILSDPSMLKQFAADGEQLTIDDFLKLTPRRVREKTGKRLGVKKALALKAAQRALKKQIKKESKKSDVASSDSNGMAIASIACGVVGLFVFGILLGPLAIIFGALGMRNSKRDGAPLKGLAIAGLICGIVATIGWLIVVAILASSL